MLAVLVQATTRSPRPPMAEPCSSWPSVVGVPELWCWYAAAPAWSLVPSRAPGQYRYAAPASFRLRAPVAPVARSATPLSSRAAASILEQFLYEAIVGL
jgi:hypothetical protein